MDNGVSIEMKNRYGQMDQDLYLRDLKAALATAISLIKQLAGSPVDNMLKEDVDNFLYDMERE